MFTLPAYVGIILRNDDKVFLIQRSNTNWRAGFWNFPGGLVEENESILDAAIRETHEEVGVIVRPENFKLIHVLHVRKNHTNTQDIIGFYFTADTYEGIPKNNEPHKITGAQWFAIDAQPDTITEHAIQALNALKNGTTYSQNGWNTSHQST